MTSRKRKQAGGARRLMIKIGVFLILGAVVNVAVAWGLAARLPVANDLKGDGEGEVILPTAGDLGWHVLRLERPGGIRLCCFPIGVAEDVVSLLPVLDRMPYWSRASVPPTSLEQEPLIEDARGWPMHSLICEIKIDDDGRYAWAKDVVHGIPLSGVYRDGAPQFTGGHIRPDFWYATTLPLRPIWPGFAINTFFYSLVFYALWALPLMELRRTRRREGRCATCGYDLRATRSHDPCPECGANR